MKSYLKTVLATTLCYLIVLSVFPLSAFSAFAVEITLDGDGTQTSPYLIKNAEEFVYAMSTYSDTEGVYYSLENDITIGDGYTVPESFNGIFNGKFHTINTTSRFSENTNGKIYNLYYRYSQETSQPYCFCISNNGELFGVMVYADVKTTSDGAIFCQYNNGIISGCASLGSITVTRDGGTKSVGFIFANNEDGLVSNCYSAANVVAEGKVVSSDYEYNLKYGFSPSLAGIYNSYYDQDVAQINHIETNRFATEYIKSQEFVDLLNDDNTSEYMKWTLDENNSNKGYPIPELAYNARIKSSKSNYLIEGLETIALSVDDGGEIYYTLDGSDPDLNSTKYTEPIQISDTVLIKAVGYKDGETGRITQFNYAKVKGTGTEDSPYQIDCEAALRAIPELSEHACYELTEDIFLINPFTSLGDFYGVLNGNNHTISNLHNIMPYYQGKGYCKGIFDTNYGLIQNLNLSSNKTVYCISTIAYKNYGLINNCSFTGTIFGQSNNVEDQRIPAYNSSSMRYYAMGGFVGINYGTIIDSEYKGDVSSSYANTVGGFVGGNLGTIDNCLFEGDVRITGSFGSSGIDTNIASGFVGYNSSYISGDNRVSGIINNSTANTKLVTNCCTNYAATASYSFGPSDSNASINNCSNTYETVNWVYGGIIEWGSPKAVEQTLYGTGYSTPEHIHKYKMEIVKPTCTKEGYTSYVCETCGNTIEKLIIPALGHDYGEVEEVEPSYEEQGYTHKICKRCGYDYKYDYVEAYKVETGSCGTNATYTMDTGKGTLVISGTGTIQDYSSAYNSIKKGYRSSAPWGSYNIKSVVIEDGIETIGKYAFFNCSEIESISLPNTLKCIGKSSLYNLNTISFIELPETVTSIGTSAFGEWRKLESLTLPCSAKIDAASYDSESAFYNCGKLKKIDFTKGTGKMPDYSDVSPYKTLSNSLEEISFANGVTYIGQNTFKGCSALETVNMPLTKPTIGKDAFKGTTFYKTLFDDKGLLISGNVLLDGAYAEGDVVIPDGITEISDEVFKNNTKISSIVIPDSVEQVGTSLFYGCSGLKSLTVPCSLDIYDENSFSGCTTLTSLKMTKGTGTMVNFSNSKYTYTPWYRSKSSFNTLILEEGIESIGAYAFRDLTALSSISINNGLKRVSAYSFYGDSSITSIILPDTLESVGVFAFYNCSGLKELTFPCSANLSNNLNTFANCTNIDKITMTKGSGEMPSYSENYRCTPWYISRANLKEFVLEEGIENIGAYMFYGNSSFTGFDIPDSVTHIDSCAFSNCKNLLSILLPKQLKTIGSNAFSSCSNLTEIVIPDSVETINSYAFQNCSKLQSINIPAKVKEIKTYTFAGCNKLSKLTLGENIEAIGMNAFSSCAGLNKLFIINNNCTIDDNSNTIYRITVIVGYPNSTAQEFAKANSRTFQEIIGQCPECGSYDLSREIIDASCTAGGYHEFTCADCGHKFTDNHSNPLGHTTVIDEAVAPSCTQTGLTAGSHCSVCGEVFVAQETIPATGHTPVTDEAKAPTCTQTGLTEGSHCSVCGEILKAQEIVPATGHTPVTDKAVAPSCTKTGLTEGSHCSVCSEILKAQEIIPATGHNPVTDKAKAPTCTETGLSEGSHCSVCNEILVAQEIIKALGHTVVIDEAVPATCTKAGLTSGAHCSVCGEVIVAQQVAPAKGHTVVIDKAKPATCTETGLTEGSHCSVCHEVLIAQETIPASGHNWNDGEVTKTPTCTEEGEKTFTCTACSETRTEKIDALGHKEVIDKAKPATCTETGLTEGSHCSVCHEVLIAQETIPASGHTWNDGEVTKSPTCKEEGVKTFTCTECGETKTEPVSKLEHSWNEGKVTKEPTYKEAGEMLYTCTNCGETKTEVIPALEKKGKLVVSNEIVRAGDDVKVKLYIDKNPGITALSISVAFPDELKLKEIKYTELLSSKPSNSKDSTSPLIISWLSPNSLDEDDTGLFATLTFTADIDAEVSDYTVRVTYKSADIVDSTLDEIPFDIENGTVSVQKPTPGDVNRDGAINMKDLVLIQQLINKWDVNIVERAADVDDDGDITMKDLVILQQYINGWEVVLK